MASEVARRVVSEALQERFAALSGDRNPMHMDPVAARRTQAGQPVVHGIHSLLWALESLAERGLLLSPLVRVRVRFLKWVYVGDEAVVSLPRGEAADPATLEVGVQGLAVLAADLTYGDRKPASLQTAAAGPAEPLQVALDLSIEQLEGVTGDVYTAPAAAAAQEFPALAKLVGGAAIAEIAAASYIVGMEAPGLHSMFSKADFTLAGGAEGYASNGLHFEVTYTDPRFRKARISITGGAVSGTLEVFFRVPPVQQAGLELLANHVAKDEFAAMRALIVGGSRGLGELTAKLVAAGGGVPTITYAIGRNDAEQVQAQIAAWGGKAELLQYDVRKPAAEQVARLADAPTHLFYFATSTIYRPKQGVLSGSMLAEFVQFYLQGFYDLCVALAGEGNERPKLVVLYPSTVFIDERPAGMTEYAMVKAAGEQMCADMNTYLPGLHVVAHRFPKLPTDQTAGVIPERETDAMDAMLPVLRELTRLAG